MTALPNATSDIQAVQAIRGGVCVGRLAGYSTLVLHGPDAARFLQNQSTQDIQALAVGQSALSASVDRHGKIQGVFYVYRTAVETYRILLETSQLVPLTAHWEKYKLFDQFSISNIDGQESPYVVLGKRTESLLLAIKLSLPYTIVDTTFQDQVITLAPLTWGGLSGAVLWLPEALGASFLRQADKQPSAIVLNDTIQEILRFEAGLPLFGRDMDEQTMLPETGLQDASVSYAKGCYLGQEVIAKVKTYGRVPKALAGLRFSQPVPNAEAILLHNAPCRVGDKAVGQVKSVLSESTLGVSLGLAYLDRENRTPGHTVQVSTPGNTYEAEVVSLPFVQTQAAVLGDAGRTANLHEALKAFAEGKDDEATQTLRALIRTDVPEADDVTVQAIEALGVILGRQGAVEEAISWMQKLLEYNPESIMAHTNLSIFYLKQGDKDRAEEEKAKATVAGMRQKAKEAGVDFKKLDEEREKREQEKKRQLEERVQLFKDALSYSPDDPLGNYGLGSVLLELMRHQEAVEPLEKTLKAQPNHSVAHLLLGKAYEATGQAGLAKAVYEKGITVAASKGDRMPLEEMQQRLTRLG